MSSLPVTLFKRIINDLSGDAGVVCAFAYGSAVFPQHGRPSGNEQIDLVILVNDPVNWHFRNIHRHPDHYNLLMRQALHTDRMPSYLKFILTSWPGPQIYYNPLVQWYDQPTDRKLVLKYGVVNVKNVISDLTTWCDLYIAGRLQKPVLWIPTFGDIPWDWTGTKSGHNSLDLAQQKNLLAAVSYVLLTSSQLQTTVSESDLFHALASISYTGDWRMLVGEDKNKVSRLVTGPERLIRFRQLYGQALSHPSIREFVIFEPTCSKEDNFVLRCLPPAVSGSSNFVESLINNLPSRLCTDVLRIRPKTYFSTSTGSGIPLNDCRPLLRNAVVRSVRRSSIQQTALGVISAGPLRSAVYALAKLRKMFASMGLLRWG